MGVGSMTGMDVRRAGSPLRAGRHQWFPPPAVTSLHKFSSCSLRVLEAPEEIVSLSFPASGGCRVLRGFCFIYLFILIGG